MRKTGIKIWIMTLGILLLFGNSKDVQAKRYYSLRDIGLSECASDNRDYSIVSIRGNTIKYIFYEFSSEKQEWIQKGKIKKAKLTGATKYYMGNPDRLSVNNSSGKNRSLRNINIQKNVRSRRLQTKSMLSINDQKWISRVKKGTVKRKYLGRYNEIQIQNGKVIKIVIRLK